MAETIDAYIGRFPRDVQLILKKIRATIRKAAPAAEESISYRIPTYRLNGRPLVYFAGFREHVSVYPVTAAIREKFAALQRYAGGKGTAKFPIDEPVPYALIGKIVKFMVKRSREQAKKVQVSS